jgi:hypothetical protein
MCAKALTQEEDALLEFVAAIVENAFRKAEMSVALFKQNGYPLSARKEPVDICHIKRPREPMAVMWSNLGAALQLGTWERAGLTEWLPAGSVPNFATALKEVFDPLERDATHGSGGPSQKLNSRVFRTWLENFSLSAQKELGVDILITKPRRPKIDFLSALADFLWEHRGIANTDPSVN